MSYHLLITRQIDEIEEKLLMVDDPIERLHMWFSFIKEFTSEAHSLFDNQYDELVVLSKVYTETPDLSARSAIKKQVVACASEIESFSSQLKRITRIQNRLEKGILNI